MKTKPRLPMRFKEWVAEKAILEGVCWNAIYRRYQRGAYPSLKVEHKSKRTVLVVGE